jgi:hypothetical protein
MSDDAFRVLFCLLDGETKVFQVKAPVDSTLLDVKELAKDKNSAFLTTDATRKDIVLWEVRLLYTQR